ncbi:MAG TPA: Rrf2 family transcriptional regulator [Rhizobiales bacterium]|nr:Rrf2 family transcriptional regulator [Hyphomicrobiales bacterium]
MLRVTRKTLLALEAVTDVAYNSRPNPVRARDITRRQGVPQRYLEQVMQQLVHVGILKGVRGPQGGYVLARERRRITAGDVVRAVARLEIEDEPKFTDKSDLGKLVVHPLWKNMEQQLLEGLDGISIEDLCQKAGQLRIGVQGDEKSEPQKGTDYSI